MDEEKTKGRTWNGYVCPGCRTVFRVAADFSGTEVICPSCESTLRLPKTAEEVRPHTVRPVKLPADESVKSAKPTKPTKPARTADLKHDDKKTSPLQSLLATSDGRLKLTLALLLPVALLVGAVVVFPPEGLMPDKSLEENAPLLQAQSNAVEKPAPPVPPVAVNEMPPPDEPAALPEVAISKPENMPDSFPKPVEMKPEVLPAPVPAPEIAVKPPPAPEPQTPALAAEDELVAAVPAVPQAAPEKPAPVSVPQPDAGTVPEAPASELVHTVVRGDTLTNLSIRYQVGVAIIKKANGLTSDVIMFGQKLRIPGGIAPPAEPAAATVEETPAPSQAPSASHTVVRGDTLERIARKYSVTPQQIMQANGMKNDVVRLGRKLVIPPAAP